MIGKQCLVFSLGPVQGFIAESRRTADGWMGSYMLAYLVGRAMMAVEKMPGVTLVEPHPGAVMYRAMSDPTSLTPGDDRTVAAIPNTILLRVDSAVSVDVVGKACFEATRAGWSELSDAVWNAIPKQIAAAPGVKALWDAQTGRHWERYWASGDSPAEAYMNLVGRKGLRDFDRWEEEGDRCTVCGQRTPLVSEDVLAGASSVQEATRQCWGAKKGWARLFIQLPNVPRTLMRSDGSERLCSICLIKRLVPWTDNPIRQLWPGDAGPIAAFPSTATMCTVLYRCDLVLGATRDERLRKAMDAYWAELQSAAPELVQPRMSLNAFQAWSKASHQCRKAQPNWTIVEKILRLDGDFFLYGESVKNEHGLNDVQHQKVYGAYRAVQDAARSAKVPDPPIYWALLTMDGDSMGRFLREVEKQLPGRTGEISRVLNEFAQDVPRIVSEYDGRTLFAGGDDVVALFPFTRVLRAAEDLRVSFRERFVKWFEVEKGTTPSLVIDSLPTLSAAIIYAHHQAPLGRVIRESHAVLKTWAKLAAGRDAVAIQRFGRGGPVQTFAAKWEREGSQLVTRIEEALVLLTGREPDCSSPARSPELASRFIYNLRQFGWMLGPSAEAAGATLTFFDTEEDRRSFVVSLLSKSRLGATDDQGEDTKEKAEALKKRAGHLIAMSDAASDAAMAGDGGLILDPLLCARFIAGEGREER